MDDGLRTHNSDAGCSPAIEDSALVQIVEAQNRFRAAKGWQAIEGTFGPMDQFLNLYLGQGKVRYSAETGSQPDAGRNGEVGRCLVEFVLKTRDQQPGARGVGVGGENREARNTHVAYDVRFAALDSENICHGGEPRVWFTTYGDRCNFAVK
jgi:hypothetical protein